MKKSGVFCYFSLLISFFSKNMAWNNLLWHVGWRVFRGRSPFASALVVAGGLWCARVPAAGVGSACPRQGQHGLLAVGSGAGTGRGQGWRMDRGQGWRMDRGHTAGSSTEQSLRAVGADTLESSVQPVLSGLLSTPSRGLMVSGGAECVPGGLTLTEWTCLSSLRVSPADGDANTRFPQ